MPHHKKIKLLNRISRIFNHKEDNSSRATLQTYNFDNSNTEGAPVASLYNNNSLPVLLQRAPSSKLLIEDGYLDSVCSTVEHSFSLSDIYETSKKRNRQSWFTTISKLKTLRNITKNKRKSSECWFITEQQRGSTIIETPDQQNQQQQEGVITFEEVIQRMEIASPLSIASSMNSTKQYNKHHLSPSSSFWIHVEQDNTTTPRTSIDSQSPKNLVVVEQSKQKYVNLAENVKNILGDAILLADKELDI